MQLKLDKIQSNVKVKIEEMNHDEDIQLRQYGHEAKAERAAQDQEETNESTLTPSESIDKICAMR